MSFALPVTTVFLTSTIRSSTTRPAAVVATARAALAATAAGRPTLHGVPVEELYLIPV
ncbi:hypothetical protein [Hymenobacter baengnokdamensis]|uniref:hypothetical protein n=1 Tax=Hymenobacter baengnokdamensis TaxID=2615203 RepID=UPI0017850CC8|nr:hypothetical protein [Hymenobacter baengnokdamensis]